MDTVELSLFHQQWLQQPITKQLKAILDDHEERLVKMIASNSMAVSYSDAQIRQLSVQLQTTKTIKTIIYDTETFVRQLSSK